MDDDEDNDDEDDYKDVDHRDDDDVNNEITGYAQVEEELEDLAAITNHDSPFEAVEISDGKTDPDDNSLEDLRRVSSLSWHMFGFNGLVGFGQRGSVGQC